jgi:hypothetical protein
MNAITRRTFVAGMPLLGFAASAAAQQPLQTVVPFQNVRVFDGKGK